MSNHQELELPDQFLPPPSHAYSYLQKAITTIVLLVLGGYGLTFFDAWPSTVKRFSYEILVYLIPSQAIYALQYAMTRFGNVPPETLQFRRADFANQHAKAEAIQRMLGHGQIPNVLRKARSLSGLERLMPRSSEIGPPGLGNWDNSCYQNSVLQGFASLPAFKHYVEQSLKLCEQIEVPAATHRALSVFLDQLGDSTSRQTTLWTPSVLKSMDSWQQQDAQEYFSRVLEALEKEAMKYSNILKRRTGTGLESIKEQTDPVDISVSLMQNVSLDENDEALLDEATQVEQQNVDAPRIMFPDATSKTLLDPIHRNPLDGMLAQALECQTCGFSEGISLTQFSCLTVNLGLRGHCYLEDLLEEYTEPENVEGVECTECTKAAADEKDPDKAKNEDDQPSPSKRPRLKPVLRTKAKQITVGRLSKDLVIHINRSIFDEYGNQRKNTALIRFPSRLKFLARWCVPLDAEGDNTAIVYELKCAVTHYGRHENGHYVALGRRGKEWYCFNDEIVTKVTSEEVLDRGNVFMLFYEAVESESRPRNTPEEVPIVEPSEQPTHTSSSSSSEEEEHQESREIVQPSPIPAMRTASGSIRPMESNPLASNPVVSAL